MTWVINPAVGCHYFPPSPQLSSQPLRGLLPVLLLGERRHDGCEQFAQDCYQTALWLRFEPRPFCAWVQHANHSATEPLTFCKMSTKNQNPTTLAQITRPQQKVSRIFFWDDIFDLSFLLVDLLSWLLADVLKYSAVALAAYNDRVLAFLRQPNITDVLKERGRTISLSSQLKSKIIQIRSDGIPALERFANDVDLITLLRYGSSQVCAFNRCYCFFYFIKRWNRWKQARKTTHGLAGQHQDIDRTPRGRVNQNDRRQR